MADATASRAVAGDGIQVRVLLEVPSTFRCCTDLTGVVYYAVDGQTVEHIQGDLSLGALGKSPLPEIA